MANQFGPWATLIDTGSSPQLSAFWQRRMTMLVPTSQTSPVLSRRNWLWLIVASTLMLVLPTFRSAPAAAEEQKAVKAGKASAAAAGTVTGNFTRSGTFSAFVTVGNSESSPGKLVPVSETGEEIYFSPSAGVDFVLGLGIYMPLEYDRVRKDLGLSSQQQAKLREIGRQYRTESQELLAPLRKKLNDLPLAERQAKMFAAMKPLDEPARKQVEKVLTPEQLTVLRNLVLCERITFELGRPRLRLSEEQMKEWMRLRTQGGEEMERSYRENEAKSLAVLSPQQRGQLDRQLGQSDILRSAFFQHPSFSFVTPPGAGTVYYQTLDTVVHSNKALGISGQQRTKLTAIYESQPAQELYKLHEQLFGDLSGARPEPKSANTQSKEPPKTAAKAMGKVGVVTTTMTWHGGTPGDAAANPSMLESRLARHPEMQQKWKDLEKEIRRQIEAVFTPEQLATLKEIALQKAELQSLRTSRTLAEIAATEQQKEELRRLREEKTWIRWQVDQVTGRNC